MPAEQPTESELAFARRWAAANGVTLLHLDGGRVKPAFRIIGWPNWIGGATAWAEFDDEGSAFAFMAQYLRPVVASLWPVMREMAADVAERIGQSEDSDSANWRYIVTAIREMEI